jgi:hypothetical protein
MAETPAKAITRASQLICVGRIRATGLRGALDWQSGGEASDTLLSIFTGADVGPIWGTPLLEVAVATSGHSVENGADGTRLAVHVKGTSCFAAPTGRDEGSVLLQTTYSLCFQITALTIYGGRVRHVNRGCGVLIRADSGQTILLNDGASITMHATFGTEGDSQGLPASLLPLLLIAFAALLVIGRYRVYRSLPICDHTMRAVALQCGGRVVSFLGFTALAAELMRSASNHHSLLAKRGCSTRSSARKERNCRTTTANASKAPSPLEPQNCATHQTEQFDSTAAAQGALPSAQEHEAAITLAMKLLHSPTSTLSSAAPT